jgi:hypothetical protein
MRRVQMMTVRGMRMVSRRLVFAGAMMFGCFAMMLRRVFMVFSSLRVMFFKFLWHWISFFFFLRALISRILDFVHAKSILQCLNNV